MRVASVEGGRIVNDEWKIAVLAISDVVELPLAPTCGCNRGWRCELHPDQPHPHECNVNGIRSDAAAASVPTRPR